MDPSPETGEFLALSNWCFRTGGAWETTITVADGERRLVYDVLFHLGREHCEEGIECDIEDKDHDRLSILAQRLLAQHANALRPDIRTIDGDKTIKEGQLSIATLWEEGENPYCSYFPALEDFQLPEESVATIVRSSITELGRIQSGCDLVSYEGVNKAIFKYRFAAHRGFAFWEEINILARIPPHPNIVPMDRLVVEEITGSRVVGFTTPFIPGGDLDGPRAGSFKMKWLKQLMQVVDDLNLKFGIAHQDIAPRNIIVDSDTETLKLIDFGQASRDRRPPFRPRSHHDKRWRQARNDIKGVVITAYYLISRDQSYTFSAALNDLNEAPLLAEPHKWVQHPDVELDEGLTALDYYEEVARWVRYRRSGIDWPPEVDAPLIIGLEEAKDQGLPFVRWARPGDRDPSRRLLATGRYADEEPEPKLAAKEAKPKPKPKPEPEPKPKPATKKAKAKPKPKADGAARADKKAGVVKKRSPPPAPAQLRRSQRLAALKDGKKS